MQIQVLFFVLILLVKPIKINCIYRTGYIIIEFRRGKKSYWNQIFILTILSAAKEDIYGEKENICGIMPHRIGDDWNMFLLFKENRMGNDR